MASRALMRGVLSQTVRTNFTANRNNTTFKQAVGCATRQFATTPKASPKAEPIKTNTPPPPKPAAAPGSAEYTGHKTATKYVQDPVHAVFLSSKPGQYATALYEAIGTKAGDVNQEFQLMKELFEEQPNILEDVCADIRSEKTRLDIVKNLAATTPMSDCTVSFFEYLARTDVLYAIPDIISEYTKIMNGVNKVVSVRVYAAHPQDAVEFQNQSQEKMDKSLKELGLPADTKEVDIQYFYDPKLVRGIVLRTDTEELDMSMATQIAKVDEAIEKQEDNVFKRFVKGFRDAENDPNAPVYDFKMTEEQRVKFIDEQFQKSLSK